MKPLEQTRSRSASIGGARWVAISIGVAASLACGGPRPAAPSARVTAPPVATRVLDQVPSDTPYALVFDQVMMSATTVELDTLRGLVAGALQAAVLSPEAAATASAEDRLASEFARELLPFDDAALRRVGWLPGESELVVYGHGLIPIVRLRADGRAAHAAWQRVGARAGITLPEGTHQGAPYVVIPPRGKRSQAIVVAFLPTQVAATIALEPAAVLDQLIDATPVADPLLPRWQRSHLDPERPASAWPVMWINPSAAVPRLRASDDLARMGAPVPAACSAAVADAVTAMPSLSTMYWRDGEELVASYVVPLPEAWRPLFADAPRVTRWLDDARPGAQLGWRVPADRMLAAVVAVGTPIQAAMRACGEPVGSTFDDLDALPLRHVRGGTVAVEVTDGTAALVVAVETLDAGALWGWLQSLLPVGPFPRPGEVRAVAITPDETLFAIATPREIGLSLGWPDVTRLQALLASRGHPAPIVVDYDEAALTGARFLGRTWGDGDDSLQRVQLTIDARGLIARTWTRLPTAFP